MDKNDLKSFLKQTEKVIKDLGLKAGELAKAVEKDASYGTKAGMIKVEQLALENDKNKLINQLGKKTYNLLKRKSIAHKGLDEIYEKIQDLENKIRGKKTILANLKRKRQVTTASVAESPTAAAPLLVLNPRKQPTDEIAIAKTNDLTNPPKKSFNLTE